MSDDWPERPKEPVRIRCDACAHEWIAAYTPMLMDRFAKLLKGLRCPMCGGDSKRMFMLQNELPSTPPTSAGSREAPDGPPRGPLVGPGGS